MRPPRGRRVAVIGYGGGATVQAADDCSRAGLVLPPIPVDIRNELKKFVPVAGSIFRNPLDIAGVLNNPPKMGQVIRIVSGWKEIDLLILHLGVELSGYPISRRNLLQPRAEALIGAARDADKPVALVVHAVYSAASYQGFFKVRQMCSEAGLPFYTSIRQAADAIDKLIGYHQNQ